MYKTVSVARAKLFFANYKKKCAARAKLFFLLITSVVVVFYHSLPLSLVLLDFVFSCLLPPPPPPPANDANLTFYLLRMIAAHCKNLKRVGKIETNLYPPG